MIFIPNKGRELRTRGSMAQWMAQAREVIIPIKSQFILNFMGAKLRHLNLQMQQSCKKLVF